MRALLLCALLAASSASFAQIDVDQPWSRATAPGVKIAAGYMALRNKSAVADRLVGASSPMAARVETHVTVKDGEILRMRQVKGYDIPSRGAYELKPGGAHLMLVDIKQPFKEGDKVPLTLKFEKAGDITVELPVMRSGPVSGAHHSH